MINMNTPDSFARRVAEETEKSILSQLNDFVSRGLILIETGPMSFYQEATPKGVEVKISQTVRLRLKDREYIEKLEKERDELKNYLELVKLAIDGVPKIAQE